jgi:hypothetical protein
MSTIRMKANIEEAFIVVYGGGWMDEEREQVDRECNSALVNIDIQSAEHRTTNFLMSCLQPADRVQVAPAIEIVCFFGLRPTHPYHSLSFEGVVPFRYRQQLSVSVRNQRTLASFFSPRKTNQWKQATTFNGRRTL